MPHLEISQTNCLPNKSGTDTEADFLIKAGSKDHQGRKQTLGKMTDHLIPV